MAFALRPNDRNGRETVGPVLPEKTFTLSSWTKKERLEFPDVSLWAR